MQKLKTNHLNNQIKKSLSVLFLLMLFVSINSFSNQHKKPILILSKDITALNFNETFIKFTTLGYHRMTSSLLWVETLMESDIDHYKNSDLNSWMFLRFNTIRVLDPHFYENYYFGGQYLSIIKDDALGAQFIYEQGLNYFPDDFWLNYQAAFHYYFELGNLDKALELYNKIKFYPTAKKSAPFLPSLVAKLMVEKNNKTSAYQILLTAYQNTPKDNPLRDRFFQSLYALKAEIDLECLNSKTPKNQCDDYDFAGDKYLYQNHSFKASRDWAPFKIKKPPKN